MSVVGTHNTYINGQLSIERISDTRFRLEGNYAIGMIDTDHQQLIYEALEIAAHSDDKFKAVFAAFTAEYLELTKDWAD